MHSMVASTILRWGSVSGSPFSSMDRFRAGQTVVLNTNKLRQAPGLFNAPGLAVKESSCARISTHCEEVGIIQEVVCVNVAWFQLEHLAEGLVRFCRVTRAKLRQSDGEPGVGLRGHPFL